MENMEHLLRIDKNTQDRILFLPGWQTQLINYDTFLSELEVYGSILALELFPHEDKESHTIEDYLDYVDRKIQELNFIPTLVVGYSFGGKLASLLQEKYQFKTLLIAPSSFKPSIARRINIKRKIIMYKLLKLLVNLRLIKKIPTKYSGSSDYKNASKEIRATLLNVKSVYIDKDTIKRIHAETNIVGFLDDSSIEWKNLQKWSKKYSLSQFYQLRGDHFAIFYDYSLLLAIIRRVVRK